MKRLKLLLFFGIVVSLHTTAAYAQWTQNPGEYYSKAQFGAILGSKAFTLNGDIVPVEKFGLYSLNVYSELGVLESTTLNLSAGIGHASYDDESTIYLNPVILGATQKLYGSDHLVVSVLGRIGVNPGINDSDLSSDPLFEFRTATQLSFVGEGLIQAGLSFNGFFSSISGGARFNSAYGADILGNLAFGYSFDFGLVPSLSLNYNYAVEKPDVVNITGTGATRYLGMGLGLGWWFTDNLGVVAELRMAPFAISNAGAPVLGLGFQFR